MHFKGSSLYQRFGNRVRAVEEIENGSSVWYSMGAKMHWVCGGVSKVRAANTYRQITEVYMNGLEARML